MHCMVSLCCVRVFVCGLEGTGMGVYRSGMATTEFWGNAEWSSDFSLASCSIDRQESDEAPDTRCTVCTLGTLVIYNNLGRFKVLINHRR
ncbi:hypothetical protein BaRGS_00026303 [Batillaria attramentaria]|uniref:Secreted protein n=1 Tax=Batillaria attramentaria TaxID=370345 RepID=A0ABD0K696_9CAEN